MRHGQPKLVATDKVSALDMEDWIEQYNRSEITHQPGPGCQHAARRNRQGDCLKQRALVR